MNKFLLVLVLALVACDSDLDTLMFQKFQKFMNKYNKKYDSIREYLGRYIVFKRNVMKLLKQKNLSYKTGITKFFDLTRQEFAKTYLNLNYGAMNAVNLKPYKMNAKNDSPDSWDWRDQGVVAPVKDQAACGSCWAFSAVANLEGLYAKEKGTIVTMSEQLLVDCDYYDSGCNGGLMEYAFTFLQENGGINNDGDYPYTGYQGDCKSDPSSFVDMTVTGYNALCDFSECDEGEMKDFLYETGPLSVALNADPLMWYDSGIIDDDSCDPSALDHGVTLVGYGTENGVDYWTVKNAWGENWGESGYFRMVRGKGMCGINTYVITATVSF